MPPPSTAIGPIPGNVPPQSDSAAWAYVFTASKMLDMMKATGDVTWRHAFGRPKDASWSYAFELTVEFTRIMLGGVISAADIAMLQKGSPDQQEAVRAKIRTVQQLLSFPGGVPAMPGCTVEVCQIGTNNAEWVRPPGTRGETESGRGAVLYLHGGAYILCGVNTHRRLMSRLAMASGLPVLGVDYRLMPDASFKDILDDAVEAFDFLVEAGYAPEQITVAGDSAGGHLSLCLAMELRARGAKQVPGAVVAFSPWIDPMQEHEDTLGSWDEFSETCYLGYVRESVGAPQLGFDGHPLGSLLRQEVLGTLQGMPPMLLQAGGKECLAAEIKTFANKAKSDSGVDIVYQEYPGMVHVFQMLAELSPTAGEAIEEAAVFIHKHMPARAAEGAHP